MNIAVLGWYDNQNTGDESYKIAFPLIFPDHSFTFVNHAKKADFSNTDLIVVGGGDVVKQSFLREIYNVDIKKIALSVTITNESDLSHLNIFEKIIVRDQLSLSLSGKYHNNVGYLPDFSFALTPNRERGKALLSEKFSNVNHTMTPKLVVVVINSYIAYNTDEALNRDVNAFEKLIHELARMNERMDSSWVFLPFSTKEPWDDLSTSSWLANRCKPKYYKNLTVRDQFIPVQDSLDIIAASDAVVSTRLHSTIFATISGIPFVDVLHHHKNAGFLKTLGREDWGNWLWELDHVRIEKLLRSFLLVGGQGSELKKFTNIAKEQLATASKYILK